jgi:hypothetical protein
LNAKDALPLLLRVFFYIRVSSSHNMARAILILILAFVYILKQYKNKNEKSLNIKVLC